MDKALNVALWATIAGFILLIVASGAATSPDVAQYAPLIGLVGSFLLFAGGSFILAAIRSSRK